MEHAALESVNDVNKHSQTPPPSITVTKRHSRSPYTFAVHNCMKLFRARLIKSPTTYEPAGSPQLEPAPKARKICTIQERVVEEIYIYDLLPLDPPTPDTKPYKHLYYFAGGGWTNKPSKDHWNLVSELAVRLPEIRISLVSYPLAPNTPAPRAMPQIAKFYHKVLEDAQKSGEKVILAGDSSGGNVVLCTVINALQADPEGLVPSAVLAISPSTDLRRGNPEIPRVARHDPILAHEFVVRTANGWRGEWDAVDPRISPLYADVTPLAKRGVQVHGVTGGYDILGLDGVLMREKLNQAFVQGKWLDWDKQMHCFPVAFGYKLPESVAGVKWIVEVLRAS